VTAAPLVLTLLALAAGDADPGPPPPARAGPWFGLQVTSEFEVDGRTWDLIVTHGVPARDRVEVRPRSVAATQRRLTLRRGRGLWFVPAGSGDSAPVAGEERAQVLRLLELRRALVFWPHGHDWSGEGAERFAELDVDDEPLMLRAVLDPDIGRPHQLEVLDDTGALLESATDVTWTGSEPTWPAALTLRAGGVRARDEVVTGVVAVRLGEDFFQPLQRATGLPVRRVRAFRLSAAVGRRFPLDRGLTLEEALARADELAVEAAALDPSVSPAPTLLLDRRGAPTGVWLEREGEAREGWEVREPSPAIGVVLASPKALRGRDVAALLREAVRRGERPGPAMLRVRAGDEGPRRAELVLVLERD